MRWVALAALLGLAVLFVADFTAPARERHRLAGTYDLMEARVDFRVEPATGIGIGVHVLRPPDTRGQFVIAADGHCQQAISTASVGNGTISPGRYEVFPREGRLLMTNPGLSEPISVAYRLDGDTLITTVDVGAYAEQDTWVRHP